MKKMILSMAVALAFALMALPALASDKNLKSEVLAVWNKYNKCYETGDLQGMMSTLSSDPVSIGTGPGEFWVGLKANEESLGKTLGDVKGVRMDFTKVEVGGKGDVAWMAAECFAQVELKDKVIRTPARLSTVFLRENGQWKIHQCHLSVPTADLPYHPAGK